MGDFLGSAETVVVITDEAHRGVLPATAERRGKLRGAASFAGLGSRRTQFDVF